MEATVKFSPWKIPNIAIFFNVFNTLRTKFSQNILKIIIFKSIYLKSKSYLLKFDSRNMVKFCFKDVELFLYVMGVNLILTHDDQDFFLLVSALAS